jgi:hypothetical protein
LGGKKPDPLGKNAPSPCTVFGDIDVLYRQWSEFPKPERPAVASSGPPRCPTPEVKLHRLPFVVSPEAAALESRLGELQREYVSCQQANAALQRHIHTEKLRKVIQEHEALLRRDTSALTPVQRRAKLRLLEAREPSNRNRKLMTDAVTTPDDLERSSPVHAQQSPKPLAAIRAPFDSNPVKGFEVMLRHAQRVSSELRSVADSRVLSPTYLRPDRSRVGA